MPTPGQAALAEAARLEAARVYSQLCRQQPPKPLSARALELEARLRRQGPPVIDLTAERGTRISAPTRRAIETAIARTGGPAGAIAEGHDPQLVNTVWTAMSA